MTQLMIVGRKARKEAARKSLWQRKEIKEKLYARHMAKRPSLSGNKRRRKRKEKHILRKKSTAHGKPEEGKWAENAEAHQAISRKREAQCGINVCMRRKEACRVAVKSAGVIASRNHISMKISPSPKKKEICNHQKYVTIRRRRRRNGLGLRPLTQRRPSGR